MKNSSCIVLILTLLSLGCKKKEALDSLKDGLLVYYPLNGNVLDSSGLNNHGKNEFVSFVADRKGKISAGNFNGTSSRILIKNNPALNLNGDFTISCWFKADSIYDQPGTVKVILSKHVSGDGKNGYVMGLWNNSSSNFSQGIINFSAPPFYTDATYPKGNSGVVLINKWYHYLCTYSRLTSTLNYFLDGKLIDSKNLKFGDFTNAVDVQVGAAFNYGSTTTGISFFNGTIDEVRIYDRVVTNEEVVKLAK